MGGRSDLGSVSPYGVQPSEYFKFHVRRRLGVCIDSVCGSSIDQPNSLDRFD